MGIIEAVKAWVERNIIADDPNPGYSRLDKADGLDQQLH